MHETFRKDLTHLTWDEVYARQVRQHWNCQAAEWMRR